MSTSAVYSQIQFPKPYFSSRLWCVRTELVNAEDQDGLVDLESQDLGLD
jgi:hypothetical protein